MLSDLLKSSLEAGCEVNNDIYFVQEGHDGTHADLLQVPITLNLGPLTTISAGLALLPRGGKGSRYRPSKLPSKPLDIWGYEASPFVK